MPILNFSGKKHNGFKNIRIKFVLKVQVIKKALMTRAPRRTIKLRRDAASAGHTALPPVYPAPRRTI
jgi:hypothetical protein